MPVFMVDSSRPANAAVQPGLTLWDDVAAWAGAPPRVWGRYLGDGYGAAVPLTAAEADFLINVQRCAILPIYNMATAKTVSQGLAAGQAAALAAIHMAQAIGVPAGVYVACDIEAGWPLSEGWIVGWAQTMRAGPYAGSGVLYGALNTQAFAGPFTAALSNPDVARTVLWAATPVTRASTAAAMPPWSAQAPSVATAPMVGIWQFAEGAYGGVVDLDEIDETLLRPPIWAPPWWN